MKPLVDQLACARRELALRENAYPKRVESGRMKTEMANHEIECMASIVATLDKMQMLAEVSEEMKAAYRKAHPPICCSMCGQEMVNGDCKDCGVVTLKI